MLDFFSQPAGFDIGETGFLLHEATQPLWRALLVGLGNTVRACLPALLLASLLGLGLALCRRSPSAPLKVLAGLIVDSARNVPLLVQLLMWYFLLIEWLPDSSEAWRLGGLWLSKGGLAFPWPTAWTATAEVTDTGLWQWPRQEVFNVAGGASVTPEYVAVVWALTVYAAAFLSEVIRGGLDAVPPSLAEAARTLGASGWQVLTRVVLPQAWRTIVPAATNQYVNLIKNSSLAVAVGYPDLVSVGNTALNQTGRTLECLGVMAISYLVLSLAASGMMNAFNRRHAPQKAEA